MNPTADLAVYYCKTRLKQMALGNFVFVKRGVERMVVSAHHDAETNLVFVVFEHNPETPDLEQYSDFGIAMEAYKGFSQLASDTITNVGEYLMECDLNGVEELPQVVYTGYGWGGAIAALQAATVKSAYLVTFGQPPFIHDVEGFCEQYPHMEKLPYDRITLYGDRATRVYPWSTFDHLPSVHTYYDRNLDPQLNPSVWKQVFDHPFGLDWHVGSYAALLYS